MKIPFQLICLSLTRGSDFINDRPGNVFFRGLWTSFSFCRVNEGNYSVGLKSLQEVRRE